MLSLPGSDFLVSLPSSMVVEEIYALVERLKVQKKRQPRISAPKN
jgi:hypothetical protein